MASEDIDTSAKIAAAFAPINSIDRPIAVTKKRRLTAHHFALPIGFVVIVALVGIAAVHMIDTNSESSTANQVKSVLSGDEMRSYNSPENNFTIQFPGFPAVTKTNTKSNGQEVPTTTYQRLLDNDSKNYSLAVYDYGTLTFDEDIELQSLLASSIQDVPGAAITSTLPSVYEGYKTLEATYTTAQGDKTSDNYIRYIIKDSRIYSIKLVGADKIKFEEFANSLSFS